MIRSHKTKSNLSLSYSFVWEIAWNSSKDFSIESVAIGSGAGYKLPQEDDQVGCPSCSGCQCFSHSLYPEGLCFHTHLQHCHQPGLPHHSCQSWTPPEQHRGLLSLCPHVQMHRPQVPLPPTQWLLDIVILWRALTSYLPTIRAVFLYLTCSSSVPVYISRISAMVRSLLSSPGSLQVSSHIC